MNTTIPVASRYSAAMHFMVIERFKSGNPTAVGQRFKCSGRMLPDGVVYIESWMDAGGAMCFQIMSAPDPAALVSWMARWSDLVDFEVIPVISSADYWARTRP